ncbi:hypothetical protein Btru_051113 [Bulinus truncatus]|nr:hypothetical protein Btru_051113 [Bulinus truncatus]
MDSYYQGMNDFKFNVTVEDSPVQMYHSFDYNNCFTFDTSIYEQIDVGDNQAGDVIRSVPYCMCMLTAGDVIRSVPYCMCMLTAGDVIRSVPYCMCMLTAGDVIRSVPYCMCMLTAAGNVIRSVPYCMCMLTAGNVIRSVPYCMCYQIMLLTAAGDVIRSVPYCMCMLTAGDVIRSVPYCMCMLTAGNVIRSVPYCMCMFTAAGNVIRSVPYCMCMFTAGNVIRSVPYCMCMLTAAGNVIRSVPYCMCMLTAGNVIRSVPYCMCMLTAGNVIRSVPYCMCMLTAGLEFALYMEPEEYLPGITDSKAFTILVHPRNSYIFPEYDGIKLTPGLMTTVALTLEIVTRLSQPYSSCVETDEYIDKYNFTYSVDLCYDVCMLQDYISNCGCYLSTWMNVVDNPNNVPTCEEDFVCNITGTNGSCSCEIPCREVQYRTRVSAAHWPSYSLGKVLVEYLCSKNDFPPERCQKLNNQSEAELRDNFVGIRIYYESMFYTQYTDIAEINLATFLSNLGGCVGLWIGVSVLSIVELLHLFADIIWRILSGIKLPNRSVKIDLD